MKKSQITIDRILKAGAVVHVTISKNESPGFEAIEFPYDFYNKKVIEKLSKIYDLNSYIIKERQDDNASKVVLEDIEVTEDNIHLYYEFMSDKDIFLHRKMLDILLVNRKEYINEILFSLVRDRLKGGYSFQDIGRYRIHQTIFTVKDTLQPIDEYIKEIEASDGFKEYMAKI